MQKNFTTNVPKILDLISSSEQIFFRKLSLGTPVLWIAFVVGRVSVNSELMQQDGGGKKTANLV